MFNELLPISLFVILSVDEQTKIIDKKYTMGTMKNYDQEILSLFLNLKEFENTSRICFLFIKCPGGYLVCLKF